MSGKYLKVLTSLALAAFLAGCSSTDTGGMFGTSAKKDETPADASKNPVVVQGQCPFVYLREGTAIYTQYSKQVKRKKKADPQQPAPEQDPNTLVMQATLDQTTRQCFQTPQGLKVVVVVHGRLVLGPAGKPGSSFSLPIRVAATDGDKTIYSQLSQFQVSLPAGQSTGQFIFTKDDVYLNEADPGGLTRLFAGIDEGPYNTK